MIEDDENSSTKKYDVNSDNIRASRSTRIPIEDSELDEAKK
jgi:hypothetical protein